MESDFGPGVRVRFLGSESELEPGVLNCLTLKLESQQKSHKKQTPHPWPSSLFSLWAS